MIKFMSRQSAQLGILIMLLTLFLAFDIIEKCQRANWLIAILDAFLIFNAQWDFWRKWKPALDRQQKLYQ